MTQKNNPFKRRIGFCGRLEIQKDPFLLIESWLTIGCFADRPEVIIVGDGVLRSELEMLLNKRSPEGGWSITGWLKNPTELIAQLDLLVITSQFEVGLPLAGMEAISLGVPVLCLDIPGISEFVDTCTGLYIVGSRDPAVIGKRITELLLKEHKINKSSVAFFSYLRMANQTLDYYNKLLYAPA